jgi:hypothetical protein
MTHRSQKLLPLSQYPMKRYYDKQDSYDEGGETFVGHVAVHDTMEDAEDASSRDGDPLPIPYDHQEDGEKLAIRDEQLAELVTAAKAVLEWAAIMGGWDAKCWEDRRASDTRLPVVQLMHLGNRPGPARQAAMVRQRSALLLPWLRWPRRTAHTPASLATWVWCCCILAADKRAQY